MGHYCAYLLYVCLLGLLLPGLGIPTKPRSFVATECYGSVLSLSCSPGQRIKVLDDFFGTSARTRGPGKCRYQPGDCTVTNNRFSSVIHRYCEGQQTCTRFQVDRRHCDHNQTNYEQVEYECIEDTDITDMCANLHYTTPQGYLSTPDFPNEYSPDRDCACTLRASHEDARIRLEATHFIIKYDNPCQDWLEITMGSRTRRLCGAYKSTLKSQAFNLTFHSDNARGHQGVWMYFSVYPWRSNATVIVDCSDLNRPTVTSPPWSTFTIETTGEDDVSAQDDSDVMDIHDATVDTTTSRTTTSVQPAVGDIPNAGKKTEKGSNDANEVDRKDANHNNVGSNSSSTAGADDGIVSTSSKTDLTTNSDRKTTSQSEGITTNTGAGATSSDGYIAGDYVVGSTGEIGMSDDNDDPRADDIRRKNREKLTGIIIISICVGGIILLMLILAIMLCVNRRRRPKRQMEREKKRRLQQRLNSLSFYDSIPLYDSLGRRAAAGSLLRLPAVIPSTMPPGARPMARPFLGVHAATLQHPINHGAAKSTMDRQKPNKAGPADIPRRQLASVRRMTWPKLERGPWLQTSLDQRASWKATSPAPPESDVDSAIYAELDKQSRGAVSEDDGRATGSPMPPGCTPNGEGPPGYSLHLARHDSRSEDIYTHV